MTVRGVRMRRPCYTVALQLNGLLLTMVFLFPLELHGAAQSTGQEPQSSFFDPIHAPRDYLSEKFVSLASGIDRFFGDDRDFQETNKSVLQMNLSEVFEPGGQRKFALQGRAKLSLPLTEKRLHLLLETDPEKNITGNATGKATQSPPVRPDEVIMPGSYAAAVRYQKAEEGGWSFGTDVGIKLRSRLQPFARARGSYAAPLGEWRLKVAQSVFWFNTIGAGESTQLDLERIVSAAVLFRASSNATWLHDKQSFDLRQDFTVYHVLNERTALLHQASVIGVSQPQSQVTGYVLLTNYRYRLHRDWLFFELSPQLHFPKEQNYRLNPLLLMRLQILFSET